MSEERNKLCIDEYLDLLKEDKNLNMAYISFGQYINILENQLQQKENIIKKLNDYIESDTFYNIFHCCEERNKVIKEIKQVLDKENKDV